jgi:hypothetical protein
MPQLRAQGYHKQIPVTSMKIRGRTIPNILKFMWSRPSACAFYSVLAAATLQAQVQVEKVTWHGWAEAVVLKNPTAAIVIVPSIGRVMNFSFIDKSGQPTEGPIWNNRVMDGKPVDPSSQQWGNFGGDKSWPELQSEWPTVQKRGWPPPTAFDSASDTIEIKGTQVTLTTPVDASYGIRETRVINLDKTAPVMTITTTYEKVQGDPIKTGIWTITQLISPENIYAEIPAKSVFENGYTNLSPAPIFELERQADRVRVRRDPAKSTKMGTDGNWLQWTGGGISLKIERTSTPPEGAEWPDKGTRLNIYTNPDRGGQPYIEMEVMGALQVMKPGDKASSSNRYTLTRDAVK